ncbi:MAG: HAD family hydrolase [Deltaproteobacteria bacterium]
MNKITGMPAAVIFDMDGVMIDSNPFHLRKWIDLLELHGIPFNRRTLPKQLFGMRNDAALRFFFGRINKRRRHELSEDLEATFRRAFKPHARPLPGLMKLIGEFKRAGIPMAVASSAMVKNIEFVVDVLKLRRYFACLVSGDHVTHPKPHPEIYLKAARKLRVPPEECVAFEDSFVGIEAAKRAGMVCIGVGSTFSLSELRRETPADLVVKEFKDISVEKLHRIFAETESRAADRKGAIRLTAAARSEARRGSNHRPGARSRRIPERR